MNCEMEFNKLRRKEPTPEERQQWIKQNGYKPLATTKDRKTSFSICMNINILNELDQKISQYEGMSRSLFIEKLVRIYLKQKEKMYG